MEGDGERDLERVRRLLPLYEGPEWYERGELKLEWGDIDGDILLEDIVESLETDIVPMFSAAMRLVLAVSCIVCKAFTSLGLQFLV